MRCWRSSPRTSRTGGGGRPRAICRCWTTFRAEGVVAAKPAAPVSALDRLIADYRAWLVGERELTPATVRGYVQLAHRFLAGRVSPDGTLDMTHLTRVDVTAFLLGECARVKPASAGCYANRLRSVLRFLSLRGLTESQLARSVPSVARWREAGIPQVPSRPEIERLLGSCDRSSRVGARDFAILILLARLGLRAVEVSRLELDDLRWRPARSRSTARATSATACRCRATSARPSTTI
jgi:integrase/recombinase XerD